jgi:hypothetical protein
MFKKLLRVWFFVSVFSLTTSAIQAKSPLDPNASETDIKNRNTTAYPLWRLQKDWMLQDDGLDAAKRCFQSDSSNEIEANMVRKVLAGLKRYGISTEEYEKTFANLLETKKNGNDPQWKDFYFHLCEIRRQARLRIFDQFPRQYVYAKHYVLGVQPMFCATTHETDSEYQDKAHDHQMGSELCLMTINNDGTVKTELLYDCPTGVIRDPCVSFNGKRIAFSMRKNDVDDDFHLYVMDVTNRRVRQITYGAGTCDMEPCYLPSGDIIFTSTRCDQAAACWWTTVMNLYICDGEGRYIRRLGFDQDHTIQPQILQDGRIVYTRWEYNDRNSGSIQTTFMMNPDGTNQTGHYGNNSYMPVSLFHVRGIPDSSKQIGIMCGHHVDQHGKLVMIDRSKGTQKNQGLTYICPKKEVTFIEHIFGKTLFSDVEWADYSGEQFQYPWALNEENYLVGYLPWYQRHDWGRGPYPVKFGIYWMNINGERELLVYDPTIASCQQFPLAARDIPQIKPSAVDQNRNDGTFYVQDVYFGPGMEGVERGTAKKLRVVGIEPRAVATTAIYLKQFSDSQKTWTSAALVFSDGSKFPITLKHTNEPQEFVFPEKKTNFVQLTGLKELFPLGINAITEWEIYGRD